MLKKHGNREYQSACYYNCKEPRGQYTCGKDYGNTRNALYKAECAGWNNTDDYVKSRYYKENTTKYEKCASMQYRKESICRKNTQFKNCKWYTYTRGYIIGKGLQWIVIKLMIIGGIFAIMHKLEEFIPYSTLISKIMVIVMLPIVGASLIYWRSYRKEEFYFDGGGIIFFKSFLVKEDGLVLNHSTLAIFETIKRKEEK